jgi:hypothetical protein
MSTDKRTVRNAKLAKTLEKILRLNEALGASEERTEVYSNTPREYRSFATKRFIKSVSRVPGSARKQADAAQLSFGELALLTSALKSELLAFFLARIAAK